MTTEQERLRLSAKELRAKADSLRAEADRRSDNAPGSFVTGASGRTRAMNKRTDAALDFTIRAAKICLKLIGKAKELEARAARLDAGLTDEVLRQRRQDQKAAEKKAAREEKKRMTDKERIFCGCFCTGWIWSDMKRERHGDYMRLCYMSYKDLAPEWTPDCPPKLRALIEPEIARLQGLRGTTYPIAGNMSITLGGGKV